MVRGWRRFFGSPQLDEFQGALTFRFPVPGLEISISRLRFNLQYWKRWVSLLALATYLLQKRQKGEIGIRTQNVPQPVIE